MPDDLYPVGWYPDPSGIEALFRYRDKTGWTEHVQVISKPQPQDKKSLTRNKLAIVGMIYGIAAIPTSLMFIGFVPGLLGLIFGILGLKSVNFGAALSGIICGSISMVFSLVTLSVVLVSDLL